MNISIYRFSFVRVYVFLFPFALSLSACCLKHVETKRFVDRHICHLYIVTSFSFVVRRYVLIIVTIFIILFRFFFYLYKNARVSREKKKKKKKKKPMEVGSSIMKTFKRFTIPRSASAIDSFTTTTTTTTAATTTTTNGSRNIDQKNIAAFHSKHPPLSYVQQTRTHYSEQDLNHPMTTTRPLSGDISSSLMIHSQANDFPPKKSKVILSIHH